MMPNGRTMNNNGDTMPNPAKPRKMNGNMMTMMMSKEIIDPIDMFIRRLIEYA